VGQDVFHHLWNTELLLPIPGAARSKAWVCDRSLAGIAGSNPAGRHGCLSLVSVVCCQVQVSATGRSLHLTSSNLWPGATITLYTYNEKVEEVRLRKKERKKKERKKFYYRLQEITPLVSILRHKNEINTYSIYVIRSILIILSIHLPLSHQNGGFSSGFATKILLGFVISSIKAPCSSRLCQLEHLSITTIIILHELGLDSFASASTS
jgi:hypothetical protein